MANEPVKIDIGENTAIVAVTGARTGHSWELEWELYDDDNQPQDWPPITSVDFYDNGNHARKLFSITSENGITQSGNLLTIKQNKSHGMKAQTYYFIVNADIDDNDSWEPIEGTFTVKPGR